ncbi:hypothetical protein [Streptomyces sp. NPDC003032]
MRIALHTKVRVGRVEAYDAAHGEVPAEPTVVHDYSAEGTEAGPPVVWGLP